MAVVDHLGEIAGFNVGSVAEGRFVELGGKAGRICNEIERRLARGVYRFGESISTIELVKEFDASRLPVSTALNQLRSAGYLNIIPQVGCMVVEPTPQEIDDFFCLYGKVEGAMAGFAAQRCKSGDADMLFKIQKGIEDESGSLSDPEKRELLLGLIALYHQTIREMASSPLEARRVGAYWRMSEFLLINEPPVTGGEHLVQSNTLRRELAAAISERDTKAAEQLMEQYVQNRPYRPVSV